MAVNTTRPYTFSHVGLCGIFGVNGWEKTGGRVHSNEVLSK